MFSFLRLPAELRIEVYRYCLITNKPIHPHNDKNSQINCASGLALNLLRTCRKVYAEGAEVLFGENEFRFQEEHAYIAALTFLKRIGPAHRAWLKNITIFTPFMGYRIYNNWYYYTPTSASSPLYMAYEFGWHWSWRDSSEQGFLRDLTTSLLNLLSSLPRLKSLNLVHSQGWRYGSGTITDESGPLELYNKVVWTGLADLLRAKPFVKVAVVRTVEADGQDIENRNEHERHLERLRQRLDISDHRTAVLDQSDGWELPSATEEGPDEWLRDLETLFEQCDLSKSMDG